MLSRRRPLPSVVIVGAGLGGVAAGVRLLRAGVRSLTIFERSDGPGGTWHDNVYPGAEVDTPSLLYSYSFMPWKWSQTHAGRDELRGYIEAVVDRFGLGPHIRYGCSVERAEWQEHRQRYAITLTSGEMVHADVLVTATGLLSDPKYPDWPGLDSFSGPAFHTSRWESQHDLTGKVVAVCGSGSSGTQAVPELSKLAARVVMFQREPGWVAPKSGRPYTTRERQALDNPLAQRIARTRLLLGRERLQFGSAAFREGTPQNRAAETAARAYIHTVLGDRPDLIDAVTPTYPYGGKRVVLADTFYPALRNDNVELVPHGVRAVTPTSVIDATGREHGVDVLVLATGFASTFLTTIDVVGRHGRSIHAHWDGDPEAFLGLMVPGFPNFFMLYGPNTNGGAIVSNLELQSDYVAAALRHMRRTGSSAIEVKPGITNWLNRLVQRRLEGTMFATFANNYYKGRSGRVVTQWPDGLLPYAALTKTLRRVAWSTRRVVPSTAPIAHAPAAPPTERRAHAGPYLPTERA